MQENPFAGSGQGSTWIPPGFGALSSIAINTYKRADSGAKITSAYFSRVFLLAAVMYVGDTDLLHWADKPETSDEKLIKKVQHEVFLWGSIVQATNRILKALNCSLFLLMYKWQDDREKLQTLRDLPEPQCEITIPTPEGQDDLVCPSHVSVPQPHGSSLPICTHEITNAVKMLGYYHSLDAKKSKHVEEIIAKGVDLVNRLSTEKGTGKLLRRDGWMNLFAQLMPAVNWGLVAVMFSPEKL